MKKFLILPNLLFENDYFKNEHKDIKNYILYEHPVYFGLRKKKMNFNKLKLVLHRASMKYFHDYLESKIQSKSKSKSKSKTKTKTQNVKYIDYNKKLSNEINKNDIIYMYDPVDREVISDLKKKIKNLVILETPNFVTSVSELSEYSKNKKRYFHNDFYKWQLKRLKIPHIKKSYDTENRKKLPKNIDISNIPNLENVDNNYIKEAGKYINNDSKLKKNYGNINLQFPVTHVTSKKWFDAFLNKKLEKYGTYQDAITQKSDTVFHSLLSPMINIGLLNPGYILSKIIDYYNKNKNKIKINNYEAFVRQLVGWREYQRMIYLFKYDDIVTKNFFNNKRLLTKDWYDGTTGIPIVDNSIKTAFEIGYLHHIVRLMVMSNFMNICKIKPDDVYKWFMEFSIDSYEWVMIGNVYGMGMWSDGGLSMRKPYISSSNYLLKMSDYKKDEWSEIWTALYYNFLDSNRDYFMKSYYKNSINYLDKNKNKTEILKKANKFIKSKTKIKIKVKK